MAGRLIGVSVSSHSSVYFTVTPSEQITTGSRLGYRETNRERKRIERETEFAEKDRSGSNPTVGEQWCLCGLV
ncbi:hypothetical protein DY000_02036966 [Brassica cretica]|uniref:Uncharacterized protein n=1 Tax=Brassica cretica TaxID=69181 RepID=A0ABQ7BNR5_BRACR|nr:hypothetical protein DY000_02036966 [Brassica cretica]